MPRYKDDDDDFEDEEPRPRSKKKKKRRKEPVLSQADAAFLNVGVFVLLIMLALCFPVLGVVAGIWGLQNCEEEGGTGRAMVVTGVAALMILCWASLGLWARFVWGWGD